MTMLRAMMPESEKLAIALQAYRLIRQQRIRPVWIDGLRVRIKVERAGCEHLRRISWTRLAEMCSLERG